MSRRPLRRKVAATITAVAGVLAGLLAACSSGSSSNPSQAQRWYRAALGDLGALQVSLPSVIQAAGSWRNGQQPAEQVAVDIQSIIPVLNTVVTKLQKLATARAEAVAQADYVGSIELYMQALQLEDAATQIQAPSLVRQLQLSFERIRQLGDHLYDLGTAQIAPLLGREASQPDMVQAAIVPDWVSSGLAPGSPLEKGRPAWQNNAVGPFQAPANEPLSTWAASVRRIAIPSPAEVHMAVSRGDATVAGAVADSLESAAVNIGRLPSPEGNALAEARIRIGLLLDAEGAYAAEAAGLLTGSAEQARILAHVAEVIVGIGEVKSS